MRAARTPFSAPLFSRPRVACRALVSHLARIISYLIEYGVCYLVLAERQDPKRLAFAYLEEVHREFHEAHGDEVDTAARPYAFMSFGMACSLLLQRCSFARAGLDATMQRIKRRFGDSRQHNLSKLNDDLQDVTRIMTTNIQDVLGRGEKLDSTPSACPLSAPTCALILHASHSSPEMTELSMQLTSESRKYVKNTRQLNLQLLYRKYGPPLVVALVVIIVLYVRFAFF